MDIIQVLLFLITLLPPTVDTAREPCIMVFTSEKETIRYEDGSAEITTNRYSTMSPGCKDIEPAKPPAELMGG